LSLQDSVNEVRTIERFCQAPEIKSKSAEQSVHRYNMLSLLRNQLICLGVKAWDGGVTEIERTELDQENRAQHTALRLAVVRRDIASVRALLKAGASTEIKSSTGQTIIHLAAENCDESMVQALLDAKANPDAADNEGKSCLDMASAHSHNNSCCVALKRIGADGWTPLMVAAEKGKYAIEEYLLCRKFCLSVLNRISFPEIFRQELTFYSGLLPPKTHKLEWGRKFNMAPGNDNSKVTTVDVSLSCALGSEEFMSGIHTWKILVDFTSIAWIGVARNSDDVACDPQTSKSSKTCYIVYFCSLGTEGVVGANAQSKPVFFDKVGGSSFSSGQTVELRLDTFKNSLEMIVDGVIAQIAHDIDARSIHPYVCFSSSGSASFVESSSCIANLQSIITEEERCAGCDNSIWSLDLDVALGRCFKLGNISSFIIILFCKGSNFEFA
jgi:ankyrin repeat protein